MVDVEDENFVTGILTPDDLYDSFESIQSMSKPPYCLTKADLAETLFANLALEKQRSVQIVEDFIEILKEALEREHKVMLSGFGTFVVNAKKPRRGRNPQTGDPLILRARHVVKFKPSQLLKKVINGGVDVPE